ncbi:tryptophan-rich sensory protein [Methylobacterium sp. J-078]|uniref:TspO/MBR family protein n=1 Tax=Methylobacterium sp. J-078 TaxID=2836657 RepID=UPI001FB867CB|nr:TspO/MBR family protein [Methylobacterium sp. J-078]MCJ2046913.1 tryptophan-rich sensory protein [Methylobacterium sp. J-078]
MNAALMGDWGPPVVAAGVAVMVALAGGLLTTTGPWYHALRRPSWKPPDWAFGPVWTTIFTLTAISGVMAWNADSGLASRTVLVVIYGINAVFNIAWSGLFFRMRRPDWALLEVVFLWVSIAALILVTARVSGLAATLLLPYLVWVGIAACLNRAIVRLNGPFRSA